MANYDMIGFRIGFDSTEVTKGTQKAKGDFDKLKTSLGPIGESMSKIGLSVITPLAAFGKLAMSVWDFAKASKDSSSEVERNLYELTTAADGLSEGITRMAGNAVGRLASIGKQIGNTLVSIGEFWGIADKGATEASEAEERYQRAAVSAHKSLLESLPVIKQIIELRDKQNAQAFARLPIDEQIEQITNRLAEAETRRIEAVRGSKAEKQAELDVMRLQAVQADALEKQAKEQADAERKSDALIAKARADGIAQEKKAADELRESKRLGKEEELEYFKLSAKKAGDLTNEETKRLEVLKLQMQLKAKQVEADEAQDKAAKTGLESDRATVIELNKQADLIKQQIALKSAVVESTQAQLTEEQKVSEEIEKQNRLKKGQQSGWGKTPAGREMIPYLQEGETRVIQKIGRSGADYESQDLYDLQQVLKNLGRELEAQLDYGREHAIERRNNWLASMVENEIKQVQIAIENKEALARYNEKKMIWDEANSVKNISLNEKMLSINERMERQLEQLNARFNSAGLTTTKQVNT